MNTYRATRGASPWGVAVLWLLLFASCTAPQPPSEQTSEDMPYSSKETALKLVDAMPEVDGDRFDPIQVIACSNYLSSLGHGPAIDALTAYVGDAEANNAWQNEAKVLPLLRCTFVRREGDSPWPAWGLGKPGQWPTNAPSEEFPLFPIAIVGDVPFLLVGSYSLAGHPQSPQHHISFCRLDCKVRPNKLKPRMLPTDAANELAEDILNSALLPKSAAQVVTMIRIQALRALGDDYWKEYSGLPSGTDLRQEAETKWEEHVRQSRARGLTWGEAAGRFITSPK